MPKPVTPKVFLIASSETDKEEMRAWLEHLGVSEDFQLPEIPDEELLIAMAAKRCYMSFEAGMNPNVTKVREDYAQYFDNILKSGHGSVLEHAVFSFALEGVSRVFTAEMNRHRAGWAISEGSMRFIRFDQCIPWVLPLSIRGEDVAEWPWVVDTIDNSSDEVIKQRIADAAEGTRLEIRKQLTRAIFDSVFSHVEHRYAQLLAIWDMDESDKDFAYKKAVTSCLRRIVPLGVSTGGVWTGNVRALRHVLTMRCAPSAEEEICEVFSTVAKRMAEAHPLVFGDFAQDENGFWRPKYVKV